MRIGYAAGDLMFYGTGGFAYGREDRYGSLDITAISGTSSRYSYYCKTRPECFVGSSSRLATGWTLGGGFEYAIWKGVSFKSEYLYVDLDDNRDRAVRLTAQPFPTYRPSSFTASRIEPLHTIRFGLNFKVIPAIRHFMEEGLGSK